MANFNASIDLLSIPGAKPMTINDGTAEKPKMVNYICIPADLNEVTIQQGRGDRQSLVAYIRLAMRALGKNYIDSIVASRQRNGDEVDMSKIETHELTLSHTAEFSKAWAKAVAASVLKEHPEWAGQNPEEKSADAAQNALYYEVRRRINKRVGKAYMMQTEKTAAPVPPSSFATPAGYGAFDPQAAAAAPMMAPPAGEMAPYGDLPF